MMHEVKSLVRTRGATCLNVTIESAGDRATKRSETGLRAPTSRRLALPFLIASLSPPLPSLPALDCRSGTRETLIWKCIATVNTFHRFNNRTLIGYKRKKNTDMGQRMDLTFGPLRFYAARKNPRVLLWRESRVMRLLMLASTLFGIWDSWTASWLKLPGAASRSDEIPSPIPFSDARHQRAICACIYARADGSFPSLSSC